MNKKYLGAQGFIRKGTYIFFVDLEFCLLCRLNLQNYEVEVLHDFSKHQHQIQNNPLELFSHYIIENGNDLFFAPVYGKEVGIYNLCTKEEKMVSIGDFALGKNDAFFLSAAVLVCGRQAWFFPINCSNGIYVLNLDSHEAGRDDELSEKLKDFNLIVPQNRVIYNNMLYIGVVGANLILAVNVEKKEVIKKIIPNSIQGLSLIEQEGNYIWFTLSDRLEIYKWSLDDDGLIRYCVEDQDIISAYQETDLPPYVKILSVKNNIYILGWGMRAILKVNIKNGLIEKAFDFPKSFCLCRRDSNKCAYSGIEMMEDKLLAFPCIGNKLLVYDTLSHETEGKDIVIEKDKIPNYKQRLDLFFFNSMPREEGANDFTLNDCLEYEYRKNDFQMGMQENVGKHIWEELSNEKKNR